MRVLDVDLVDVVREEDGKITVDWTHVPHRNDPLEAPLFRIMAVATMMFSPPLSPRTREGQPHTSVDLMKLRRTVSGKLFPETFMPVTCKQTRTLDFSQGVNRL